ncbi:MAG: right-handed parallel beta-helix repeat-containing protein [Spirochaetales bacterium]|nr:right-handed parallel beta-helix repeat-containing protein [Spirochaetales bacterium]
MLRKRQRIFGKPACCTAVFCCVLTIMSCNMIDTASIQPLPYDDIFDIADPELSFTGTTYYVAVNGHDSNAGTEAAPWATIQKAAATLGPGQRAWVREGTYYGRVTMANDGSEGSPIILAAFPGDEVTIDGTGVSQPENASDAGSGVLNVEGRRHIVISGFRVINSAQNGIRVGNSSNVYIKDCYTWNTFSSGIGSWFSSNVVVDNNEIVLACNDGSQECLTVAGGDTFIVRNNHVHHSGPGTNGGEGIDAKGGCRNGLLYGNTVHDINRLGIYVDAWADHTHDIKVYGNTTYACNVYGIAVASENCGLLENIQVFNNVSYGNPGAGIVVAGWGIGSRHPIHNVEIINNTVVDNYMGIYIADNDNLGTVKIANNLLCRNGYYSIISEIMDGLILITNNMIAEPGIPYVDPGFIDDANRDYHLTADSSAINQGSTHYAPPFDFDNRTRIGKPDTGAFEYGEMP